MKGILKITFAATLILIAIPAASTASNGTLVVGVPAPLDATDLTAICMDLSRDGNAAWIELEKDGEVLYSHILKQGDPIVYESDSGLLTYRIDATFHGTQTNMAKISSIDPSSIDQSVVKTRPDSIMLSMGERWNGSDGTEIVHKMMGVNGAKAWIELEKDGEVRYSHILTEGDLIVYKNDSGEWVAYRIDAIFRGIEHDMIELSPVDPPIDLSTIDFNYVQGLTDNFILDVGDARDIGGGTILRCTGIDMSDSVAWIELSRDGEVLYSHILREGEYFTYEDAGILHACAVHRVFTGERKLVNTPVILKDGEMVNTGYTVAEEKLVEFSPVKISDIDITSIPDRSDYIMVGLGVPVELSGGAKLLLKQIDLGGEAVWIEIITDDGRFEKVINETSPFTYVAGDKNYVYALEAAFAGKEKSVIEISFVGSSPVAETPVSDRTPTQAIPAFTASAAIAGVLIVIYGRKRR